MAVQRVQQVRVQAAGEAMDMDVGDTMEAPDDVSELVALSMKLRDGLRTTTDKRSRSRSWSSRSLDTRPTHVKRVRAQYGHRASRVGEACRLGPNLMRNVTVITWARIDLDWTPRGLHQQPHSGG